MPKNCLLQRMRKWNRCCGEFKTQLRAVLAETEGAYSEDDFESLQEEGIQANLALPMPRYPPQRGRRTAVGLGFSLHADTWVHGNDREGLERLCR